MARGHSWPWPDPRGPRPGPSWGWPGLWTVYLGILQILYKWYNLSNFLSWPTLFAPFWGWMRPKVVVPYMPSVFRSYFKCGGMMHWECLCLFECDSACPSVSVVVPDECDSAVSCISSLFSAWIIAVWWVVTVWRKCDSDLLAAGSAGGCRAGGWDWGWELDSCVVKCWAWD